MMCRVLREGRVCELLVDDVVVGDVVLLGAGEHIPADGTLIGGTLTLDQAAMTGEGREAAKRAGGRDTGEPEDEASLFRGCAVLSGEGRMLVKRVGDATVLGGISREVQEETRDSPLKLRLAKLAGQISVLGYVAAVLVAAAFLFHAFAIDSDSCARRSSFPALCGVVENFPFFSSKESFASTGRTRVPN